MVKKGRERRGKKNVCALMKGRDVRERRRDDMFGFRGKGSHDLYLVSNLI